MVLKLVLEVRTSNLTFGDTGLMSKRLMPTIASLRRIEKVISNSSKRQRCIRDTYVTWHIVHNGFQAFTRRVLDDKAGLEIDSSDVLTIRD